MRLKIKESHLQIKAIEGLVVRLLSGDFDKKLTVAEKNKRVASQLTKSGRMTAREELSFSAEDYKICKINNVPIEYGTFFTEQPVS